MLTELEKRIDEHSENFNRDMENIKRKEEKSGNFNGERENKKKKKNKNQTQS